MMKAKITVEDGFRCCPDGHTAIHFKLGDIVEGHVAQWALDERVASRIFDKAEPLENKMIEPQETKKRRGRPPKKA
jgi:hypothetical protein